VSATPPLVLNVNDHVANLYMVSKMLRNSGFRVAEARSGREAIQRATELSPDVIVLDVHLPDITGFEVCRRLKDAPATKDIKIVHTSATFTASENKLQGLEAGADGYLTQPFEPQELIATVRSLVRLHETETDLMSRNAALVAAARRKDEFLPMLAHELRNPLAALQLGLPLLERHEPRDDVEARARAAMRRQTALLTQLVDDLLDVSRVTRGKIDLRMEVIDLTKLVLEVVDGLRHRVAEPRKQLLAAEVPSSPVWVAGDVGRIEQVITNLIDNASKYSDATTRIDVILSSASGRAELVVRDSGIGIDEATLPTIFDLFAQADRTLDRARGGLGIGLTLVKALVELHGGDITAESPGLGKGTTMRVWFPLADVARPAAVSRDAAASPKTAPKRVLLVDDNDDGREMLRMMCELHGHDVIEAADGPDGVERALAERPDIAFVDIGLPTIDGYEVARRLRRELGRSTRLVALSGYGSAEHREAALAAGFDEHIAKPINAAQLERALAHTK